jgi:hypothetical protein
MTGSSTTLGSITVKSRLQTQNIFLLFRLIHLGHAPQ